MLEYQKFSIGGYNFDDWSLVKELYVPEDISSSVDKSLHMSGREAFPHHLQHYVIPNDKKFIVFAVTNVLLSTSQSIGLFGTGKSYGRYPESHQQPDDPIPGAPETWTTVREDPFPTNYFANQPIFGTLVIHNGRIYECLQTHDPVTGDEEPGTPGGAAYWDPGSLFAIDWENDKNYFFNELVMVTVEGVAGAYMCTVDHLSSSDNKPCDNNWATKWNPGDEFTPDLTSQFGFSKQCLSISKGIDQPFGREILAMFDGSTGTYGRRIDAMTIGGTMKSGATLLGIEVGA